MSEDFLHGSDTGRSSDELTRARSVTFSEPLKLARGGELSEVTGVYETYGRLNEAKSNAILICHALSGDSHVARHDDSDAAGWWDIAVGPGKPIDTNRYFVICQNVLGGCRGTTGPNSTNPDTSRPYGRDFPIITVGDIVEVQRRLISHLGIAKLLAVVGGSMGGHQVLHWAIEHADRVGAVIPIAASPRLTSQAVAFDVVSRNAILRDPNFHDGQYYDSDTSPDVGLAIARMIGHITYLSRQAMAQKFGTDRLSPPDVSTGFEKRFSVGSYLGYQGDKFVERFDANSYILLSTAMDLFDLGQSAEELTDTLARSTCRWLVLSFTSDWLFPADQSQEIVDALIARDKPVSFCNITTDCGHDAFLLGDGFKHCGRLIEAFLNNISGNGNGAGNENTAHQHDPSSIFHPEHPQRLDTDLIINLIDAGASVLDLGCGDGELLGELAEGGTRRTVGVELDEEAILACVGRGINVIQADLNEGLGQFGDRQFDFVVLSRTLQAIRDVEGVVADMLRVGRRCIVSFPNFGYYKLRAILAEQGRAPEASGVLHYKWYDTPNIRFLSIADFQEYCHERSIRIHRCIALDTEAGREVPDAANLNADLSIFVISR